ncbi:MAG: hypothetical protein PWP51_1413 [Clostridiales bacterium]|jgi:hydrogenase expression/formation protein HypE|nr:hypothetical protein [Clostridiales bacterium]MDN5298860.1 hypothetical protein [Clostridiales bacterium]
MRKGKLSNEKLNDLVLKTVQTSREDILIGASIGEDCSAIAFGDMACVLSTDPITGTAEEIGKLAVNVGLNDIASSGSQAVALLLTLLCPEETTDEVISGIIRDAQITANTHNVAIIGGHTERTSAVNRIVVSITAIGKNTPDGIVKTGGAQAGDFIYMTKWAGLEGTGIIAVEKREELQTFMKSSELEQAKQLLTSTSVIREGTIGKRCGATAMHDVTEGGVLGAAYEICEASGLGCELQKMHIPIHPVTEMICNHFLIDPLKLIASGAMMLTIAPDNAPALEQAFIADSIEYAKIGVMTESKEKMLVYGDFEVEEIKEPIAPPEGDALYDVLD